MKGKSSTLVCTTSFRLEEVLFILKKFIVILKRFCLSYTKFPLLISIVPYGLKKYYAFKKLKTFSCDLKGVVLWMDQVPFLLINSFIPFSSSKRRIFSSKFPFKLKTFELEFKWFHCQFIESRSRLNNCHFKIKKFPFASHELRLKLKTLTFF